MSENKTNFIMAVRGYKSINKQKTLNFTDVTALDNLNNKVLLRIVDPLSNEYINLNDVKSMTELIKNDSYSQGVLISKHFTDNAIKEMSRQNIQHISEDYMPPFEIQDLYQAILNRTNLHCQKKCGKISSAIFECEETVADACLAKSLARAAKRHFEMGTVGLLKNDLKIALASIK